MFNVLLSILVFPFRVVATVFDTLGPLLGLGLALGLGAWIYYR